jgi:hypothetical protein
VLDTLSSVNGRLPIDPDTLLDEVMRYLAVVDAFRTLRCEPTWRSESEAATREPDSGRRTSRIDRSAH